MSLIFPKFSNLNLNLKRFNFGFGSTDNAFITVKTANQLIDNINILSSNTSVFTSLYFKVLDPGGTAPTLRTVTGTVCKCAGCPPNSTGTNCGGCTGVNTSSFYTCAKADSFFIERIATGVFNLSFTVTDALDFSNAVLKVNIDGSFISSFATISKTEELSWTVNTYDAEAGALANSLNNAIIELVLMK
jgi:hypothetical protein